MAENEVLTNSALEEVTQFTFYISETIAYYKIHDLKIPSLEWGITHHSGGWSVHMRCGALHLMSGFDFCSEKQALEFMDLMTDTINNILLEYYGLEIAPYSPDISMN